MDKVSDANPPPYPGPDAQPLKKDDGDTEERSIRAGENDLLQGEIVDQVLAAKMNLVNDAIDEIGFTPYQWKLFVLNGFGYAVDSLILLIQSIISTQAVYEFQPSYSTGLTIAVYVGMLVGALFWGISADIIGRRFAFNVSLFISSIFTIVAGASPNWYVLGLFICLSAFGAGGNLVLDTAVFLEYLPSKQQWLVTLMAAWWGLGQLIAGLFAWAFLPKYSCSDAASCTYDNNKGWRYVWYTSGAFVFVLSVLRVTIIRLQETPKFLVTEGRDEQAVRVLQGIAQKYNRPCSLTAEMLQRLGTTQRPNQDGKKSRFSFSELGFHFKGLFTTRKISLSTSLVWFSWLLIGLAYPLYNVFLPKYLSSRGASFGVLSPYITWRNYALVNLSGIPGPIVAGFMCRSKWFWGRRGTMVVGALVTMVFFFCYTQVRTESQNVGFSCTVNFCLNIYYGSLYAYSPEVFPSAHRGTGNGVAIAFNRIMGIVSAVVGKAANTSTPVPIYICATLYAVMAVVSIGLPFEPYGRRSGHVPHTRDPYIRSAMRSQSVPRANSAFLPPLNIHDAGKKQPLQTPDLETTGCVQLARETGYVDMKNETMDIDAASVAATGELSITESQTEEEVNGEEDVDRQRPAEYKKKPLAVTACELCKARKVRCDRAEPSCGWCTRNRRVCVYRERQKPGFRAGYVRELETKVNKLEAMLQMLGRRVEDHISSKDLGQTGPINLERLLSMATDSTSPQNQHPQSPSVVETQSPDTSSHERVRPARAAELMSVQSMMNTSRSADMSQPPPELPPVEMLYSLVDLYFKHVNTWCPILDRQITVEGLFRSSKHDEPDRIVLYAMVATALRFSKDPSLTPELRERYHTFAKERVLLHSLQTPSIKSLQALVILTWDFLGSSDGPASVNILAVLVRSVLQLNLQVESGLSLSSAVRAHAPPGRLRDTVLPQPSSWIEEEGRRRLFWMIYVIERYAAVATAADLVLDETEIDRSLPCRYDLFSKNHPVETRWFCGPGRSRMIINQPENLGSFSYHCEVTRILSRVQQFLQTPVDICSMSEVERWQSTYRELDDELSAWLSNLPDDYSRISQLCHSDPTSKISNWIIMHAAFVTSVVRLHSCAAYPPVRSYIFASSYNASQRCLTAVQSLREIAQDVLNTGMLDLLGPHFAFSLYAAARLLLVHTACTGTETDTSCQFFIDVLDQMGHYWSIARQYAQQLDQIWKRAHMEWQIGGETTKSAPKALAIMRRRAYEVHISAIQRPSTAMKPLPTKPASVEDIEYLEVFHFFNYPRLPASMVNSQSLFEYFLNVDSISAGKDYFMAAAPLAIGSSEMGWSYST